MDREDVARKRLGAAAVILNDAGDVLLVRHAYGPLNWELPGGYAEAAESIVSTAEREGREEKGLTVPGRRTTAIYYDPEHDVHHFVFSCERVGRDVPAPGGAEIAACAFWPPCALPRPMSDFTMRRVADAM